MALHRSEQKYELVTGKLENESTVRPPKTRMVVENWNYELLWTSFEFKGRVPIWP